MSSSVSMTPAMVPLVASPGAVWSNVRTALLIVRSSAHALEGEADRDGRAAAAVRTNVPFAM